jgi:UDP-N-acetylmuramyl pentapeptide phosphotransferase/UDP-N-acetylglucosamine-1-phosphate transferase
MDVHSPAFFTLIVFLASWLGTGAILLVAHSRTLLALPNERSSHTTPTPFGGGIVIVLALVAVWYFNRADITDNAYPVSFVIALTVAIAILSFADDIRELPIYLRLLTQAAAIAFVLYMTPAPVSFFGGVLPPELDNVAAGVLWLWFINLFNFMDGIDGITGVELISIGGGITIIALIVSLNPMFLWLGLTILASAVGFLWWNWQPAKIFLGDVGSISLGFFLGWLLLILAAEGQWAAALILPLYYLTDTTVTLIKRAVRGEKIWHAHNEHFYQRAVQRGLSHRHVSIVVMIANAGLIGSAILSALFQPWIPLLGAAIITVLLLLYLKNKSPTMFGKPS